MLRALGNVYKIYEMKELCTANKRISRKLDKKNLSKNDESGTNFGLSVSVIKDVGSINCRETSQ